MYFMFKCSYEPQTFPQLLSIEVVDGNVGDGGEEEKETHDAEEHTGHTHTHTCRGMKMDC